MLKKTILVGMIILPAALWASAAISDDCGYKADGKYHCGRDCGYKADGQFHCGTNCGYKSDGKFHCEGEG